MKTANAKTKIKSAKPARAKPNAASEPEEEASTDIEFGSLPTLVGYRVRRAGSVLFQTFSEALREEQLAPGQYSVLLLIGLNPGLSQMRLAEATGIDRSTIVPIISRFVKMGWVRRVRRKEDRRVYSLRLTPAGEALIAAAQPKVEMHEKNFAGVLTKAEKKTLIELLARLTGDEI
ncbi:MarR family winged helix-turn-helix transcriptional regulator [Marinicaulis aureus]|uniref:MarR family winged helix-turn-helix transcriptional regulator n=1 Tax=Hyphococcus aureus TaxID=2666033 RepID=A0ABW1KW81_9PROT